MKVYELIAYLQRCKQDAHVVTFDDERDAYYPVNVPEMTKLTPYYDTSDKNEPPYRYETPSRFNSNDDAPVEVITL